MLRIGFIVVFLALFSCNNKKKPDKEESGFSFEQFSTQFRSITPPYQLSDTGLQKNKDTGLIRFPAFSQFISDSLKTRLFGKGSKPRYTPMVRMSPSKTTSLYLVKAVNGAKKATLLLAFENEDFTDVLPFLVPDTDPSTFQISSIDRSYSITKNIFQKKASNPQGEGKDVYDYDATSKKFSLTLTNPLDNSKAEVINPIDTLPRKHKFAGDYGKDKKNFVSVRDGRGSNQLMVFVHIQNNSGDCTGELKGNILLTGGNTAVYRQAGDPCVLTFRFSGTSVTLAEDQGCGAHRDIDCSFDGVFTKRKEVKPKAPPKRTVRK